MFFLTGTDEHGQKVAQAAAAAGQDPQAFVDGLAAEFADMTAQMDVSNDDFIRTTEERHKRGLRRAVDGAADSGEIYLGHYEGWYALRDEAFYGEDELLTRPDGTKVSPFGSPVEWVREPNYLFRLSAWGDRLLAFYEANPDFLGPLSTRNEVLSFVRGGLTDLSVSRASLTWGVPVPGDPGAGDVRVAGRAGQLHHGARLPGHAAQRWAFWPADMHFVGKDIARFHTVYWPAFLMAAGLPVPKRVYANGWWTVEGEKMSKSVGNVIDPRDLVAGVRAGPAALLPAAGDAVRQRRRLQPPRPDRPHEQRAGQRPRQPGATLAVADRQELRRRAAGARAATEDDAEMLAQAPRCRLHARRSCCGRPTARRWTRPGG